MKYSKTCECCGHKNTAFTYNLNVGKVSALRKLTDHYEITKKPVQLGDIKITNSQYTNFCHLAYFNLARHIPGGWVPTDIGIAFIYGEIGVQVPVAVLNGVILNLDHEAWGTQDKKPTTKYVQDIHDISYKKHSEYAEEVTGHRLFN